MNWKKSELTFICCLIWDWLVLVSVAFILYLYIYILNAFKNIFVKTILDEIFIHIYRHRLGSLSPVFFSAEDDLMLHILNNN